MSDKKKSIAKITAALLALLGAAGGATEAGVMPDLADIEQLGVIGSFALILYIELRLLPLIMPGLRRIVAAPQEVAEPHQAEAPTRRSATHPGLKVMKRSPDPQ